MSEYQYLDLLNEVRCAGERRTGRNGDTFGLFGRQIRFDLADGFPLLTTKRVHFTSIVTELLWFIRGETNTKFLHEHGVTIWDEWADENGDLGPIYGKQWRDFSGIDQLQQVVAGLRSDPYGRRHIVSAWNPVDIPQMALPPCHCLFQFFVADGKLSCQLYQRSADIFLGVPFNIASYALLTHLVAREVGLEVGDFVHTFGDVHLYANHMEQAITQLGRTPRDFPRVMFRPNQSSMWDMDVGDIAVVGYDPHPKIAAPVST